MKPLLSKDLPAFLNRFDYFKNSEINEIEIVSPTKIKFIFRVQDRAREFNWINLKFEFNNIIDAKLPNISKLSLINMNNGISIIFKNNTFAFALDDYNDFKNIKNSISYVICSNLKYQEDMF